MGANQPVPSLDISKVNEELRALEKPIKFYWAKGTVSDVFIDPEDPEWSLNIKCAILSTFVLQISRESMSHTLNGFSKDKTLLQSTLRVGDYLPTFTLMEDDITGYCESTYIVNGNQYAYDDYESSINANSIINANANEDVEEVSAESHEKFSIDRRQARRFWQMESLNGAQRDKDSQLRALHVSTSTNLFDALFLTLP